MKTDTLQHVAAASPPASVAGLSLAGYPVADWVAVTMLIYAILLVATQLPKAIAAVRTLKRRSKNEQSND